MINRLFALIMSLMLTYMGGSYGSEPAKKTPVPPRDTQVREEVLTEDDTEEHQEKPSQVRSQNDNRNANVGSGSGKSRTSGSRQGPGAKRKK